MNEELAEDNDAGNSFLDCAAEVAHAIDNLEGRSEVTSLIAIKYAESGQLDVAVDLVETIDESYLQDQALAGLAAKCVELGATDTAEELSDKIGDDSAYAFAREEMAVAQAEAGAFEESIEAAHKLTESGPSLSRIALVGIARGLTVQALEVARSLDYPDLKAPVLVELTAKACQDGRNPDALELLQEATEAADEIEFPEQQISTLISIASLNKKCGEEAKALEILTRAHLLCTESEGFDKDVVLPQIAAGFAELQRYDSADEVMEEIADPFQFAQAMTKVALEYHKAGDSTNSLALLVQAMEIAREEEVYGEQALARRELVLDEMAVCYATLGHYQEALQVTELMISTEQQYRTLGAIGKLCVIAGNNSRVFEVTERFKDTYVRVLCEVEIVDAFITSEQFDLADHTLLEALARADTIERAHLKAQALMEIAPRLVRREQASKASEVLFDALKTSAKIDDSYRQSLALISLAGKYRELGLKPGTREQTVLEEIRLKLE